VENNFVQGHAVQISVDRGQDPRPQSCLPVAGGAFVDRRPKIGAHIVNESLLQRRQQMLFRLEVEIKRAFGYVGSTHDGIDAGGSDAPCEKQLLCRVHQFFPPNFRWFRARARRVLHIDFHRHLFHRFVQALDITQLREQFHPQ
jgi:hypothetical protein